MAFDVLNRQRKVAIDVERFSLFAERTARVISGRALRGATLTFVSDRKMRELNYRFRGRRSTTDVLSFSSEYAPFEQALDGSLGDIVISVERAVEQAAGHGLTFEREMKQLILHGLLHLCGYDHETDSGEMNSLELKLRRRLGI